MDTNIDSLEKIRENFKVIKDNYNFSLVYNALKNNLDISWCLEDNLYAEQIELIILGLEKKIDVSWYANSKFLSEKMEYIIYGLLMGVDVSIYANPRFNKYQMRYIYLGLSGGEYPNGSFFEFYYSCRLGKKVVDVSWYADPEFSSFQMYMILEGLRLDFLVDVSVYAKKEYNDRQMEEIFLGMIQGLDYTQYANPSIPYDEMRRIREELYRKKHNLKY